MNKTVLIDASMLGDELGIRFLRCKCHSPVPIYHKTLEREILYT